MADIRGTVPFLGLPIELRNNIYSHLLSTEYTRQDTIKQIEISTKNSTGDHYIRAHTYHFQPAILTCNRQINEEAMAVFRNSNLFVSISHNHGIGASFSEQDDFLARFCEQNGLPVLAHRRQARAFRGYAMELYLGRIRTHDPLGMWWNSTEPRQWEARPKFMIAADDLLQFCKLFLHGSGREASEAVGFDTIAHLDRSVLLVDVLHPINQLNSTEEYPRPAIRRLLEPLCYLHNIMLPIIECPAPKSYIEAVKQKFQRKAPSAAALNLLVASMLKEGDTALSARDFHSAALQYESAIDKLRAGSQDCARYDRMVEGKWSGAFVRKIKYVLSHRLELGLALANLLLQHYEMAHHWTLPSPRVSMIRTDWFHRCGITELWRARVWVRSNERIQR